MVILKNLILGKEAQVFGEICDSIKETKDGRITWVQLLFLKLKEGLQRKLFKNYTKQQNKYLLMTCKQDVSFA
jgi:hypothetical protein